MTNPPIRRHVSLQPFSRDHYNGLVQARHLVIAADASPAVRRSALREFVRCWTEEIAAHFSDEERLLTRLMPGDAYADRLQLDHTTLRKFAAEAATRQFDEHIDPEWIRRLGTILHDHIRWEERSLFPAIEQSADEDDLAALGRATEVIETNRNRGGQCRMRYTDA